MSSSDRLRRQSTICAIVTTASLAATLISTVPASAESAEEKYDLKLGKISHNVFDWSVQPVSVKNTTGVVADIKVECGFYSGDTLLGAGTITIPLIKPSQVAYGDVSSTMEGANRADCRIVGVRPYQKNDNQ